MANKKRKDNFMVTVLLPIKPKYVDKILSGEKKFEYRKKAPTLWSVDGIVIYATAPVKKIVAQVKVEYIWEDGFEYIWEGTKEYAGISKPEYDKYFENTDIAYAYALGEVVEFKRPLTLDECGIKSAPQSFVYLNNKQLERMERLGYHTAQNALTSSKYYCSNQIDKNNRKEQL
jgi:predicted transcriptional regulator